MLPEYREFLEKVYALTNGDEDNKVTEESVGKELGLDPTESKKIVKWLIQEGLLKRPSMGYIRITHEGIKEIEEKKIEGK